MTPLDKVRAYVTEYADMNGRPVPSYELLDFIDSIDRESIFDLHQRVREHPDHLFSVLFVRADVPEGRALPSDYNPKHIEEYLVTLGNEHIDDLAREED